MLRRRALPPGWYPSSPEAIRTFVDGAASSVSSRTAVAAISPHAGWRYSGALAVQAVGSLHPDTSTVVVVGGHLRPREAPLVALEDEFETPLGNMPADVEIRDHLVELGAKPDERVDNSVEVLLPIVAALFPEARLVWLRVAPDTAAVELGEFLGKFAAGTDHRFAVVGSTDLTHYGPAYRFSPGGSGDPGAAWTRQNDSEIIAAFCENRVIAALDHANKNRSACCSGGAVVAATFARAMGRRFGRLLGRGSSLDVRRDESHVGYASIAFSSSDDRSSP